jgi:glycosyltransferase involved in cell wall biosynthesis
MRNSTPINEASYKSRPVDTFVLRWGATPYRRRVLILEEQMKQYRVPFYERLRESLREEGIQLKVAYSDPSPGELEKMDNCDLPESYGIKVNAYRFGSNRFLYQPLMREIVAADLVIIDHANRFVVNHFLLPLSRLGLKKVAYWGLGENMQSDRSEISEWYKKRTLNWVDWWFAYTSGTAKYLRQHRVPDSKITTVQNSVDTLEIQARTHFLDEHAKRALRLRFGITPAARVGICVGMLHKVKSLPFLLDAGRQIRECHRGFHLMIVGGGPDQMEITQSMRGQPWVHYVGPKFGDEKSDLLAISDLFLLPGRVGLGVLDGFAAGLPVLATRLPIHGPEFEYLEDGQNGLLTQHEPQAYAQAAIQLLQDPDKFERLRVGARLSCQKYSVQAMVENFHTGIQRCLSRRHRTDSETLWGTEQSASSNTSKAERP